MRNPVGMSLIAKQEHLSIVKEDAMLEERKLEKDEWDFSIAS